MADRRRRAWADRRFDSLSMIASVPQIFDLLANAPTIDTMTVSRILGHLDLGSAVSTDPQNAHVVDVGIGVSSTEAFTVGLMALPDPRTETEYPPRGWLYAATRVSWVQNTLEGSMGQHAVFDFDLGAMRKIDKGVLFMWVVSTFQLGTAGTLRFTGRVRSLCLT